MGKTIYNRKEVFENVRKNAKASNNVERCKGELRARAYSVTVDGFRRYIVQVDVMDHWLDSAASIVEEKLLPAGTEAWQAINEAIAYFEAHSGKHGWPHEDAHNHPDYKDEHGPTFQW